jgi:8-oxo-dGTP pyrophosphatase MutT (NUDIX family)
LVRRRSGDAFGDSYTFPGGVLDPDEADARPYCSGLAAHEADALLGVESGGLDYYSAVVRELLEETGVFLGTSNPITAASRKQLHSGDLSWPHLLGKHHLSIACNELLYFAHWITPSALPKRWSTRFFLTVMPHGQQVSPDGIEITDYCWVTAGEALASAEAGERDLPFPTRKTIEALSGLETVHAMRQWALQRQAAGVPAILPEIHQEDGRRRIFLPEIGE